MNRILILSVLLVAVCLTTDAQSSRRRALMVNRVAGTASSNTPDIAWWKFSENTGTTVADSSTRGTNTLTLSSSSMWVTGNSGYGIDGNNSTFYASCPLFNCDTSVVTVCFWMTVVSWPNYDYFVELSADAGANNHSFAIDCGTTAIEGFIRGTLDGRHENVNVPSTATWLHHAYVFDNSTANGDVKHYIGGSLQSPSSTTDTKAGTANFGIYTLYLMSRAGANYFTDASMDDFRVYSGDVSANLSAIIADPQ